MSNSPLVDYTQISANKNVDRIWNGKKYSIKKITIHHMGGNLSVETCGRVFSGKRQASSNYGIGSDGRVGLYVDEKDRPWTSGSPSNDYQAITIEVANNTGAPNWTVSDVAYAKLIDLCVDICKRNGIEKLVFTGDANGNLTYHQMFAATGCPGPYLKPKFPEIAEEVNKRLNAEEHKSASANIEPTISAEQAARDVLAGKYGNGSTRKQKLEAAGFDYSEIQSIVNQMANKTYKPAEKVEEKEEVNICYIVKKGDTLDKIAQKFDTTYQALATYNKIKNPNLIFMGQKIYWKVSKSIATPTPVKEPTRKSNEEIAKEVLNGKWGSGTDRKKKIEVAGYNYDEVQAIVNTLVGKPAPAPKKSVTEIAKEVLQGKWGNGVDRKKKLEAAGYNYADIQDMVNKLLR